MSIWNLDPEDDDERKPTTVDVKMGEPKITGRTRTPVKKLDVKIGTPRIFAREGYPRPISNQLLNGESMMTPRTSNQMRPGETMFPYDPNAQVPSADEAAAAFTADEANPPKEIGLVARFRKLLGLPHAG